MREPGAATFLRNLSTSTSLNFTRQQDNCEIRLPFPLPSSVGIGPNDYRQPKDNKGAPMGFWRKDRKQAANKALWVESLPIDTSDWTQVLSACLGKMVAIQTACGE